MPSRQGGGGPGRPSCTAPTHPQSLHLPAPPDPPLPAACAQPGDGEWKFWRAWELYGIRDWPPSNILWSALPSQARPTPRLRALRRYHPCLVPHPALTWLAAGRCPGAGSHHRSACQRRPARLLTAPCLRGPPHPQLPKLAALFFIVAFGSSMDIAAIQADSAQDLDYNSELVTVGAPPRTHVLEEGLRPRALLARLHSHHLPSTATPPSPPFPNLPRTKADACAQLAGRGRGPTERPPRPRAAAS